MATCGPTSGPVTCRKPTSPGCTSPPARPPRPGSPTPTENRSCHHRRTLEQRGRRDQAAAAAAARHSGCAPVGDADLRPRRLVTALLKRIVDAKFDLTAGARATSNHWTTRTSPSSFTHPDTGIEHAYSLGETTTELDCGKHGALSLREIHKRGRDGSQPPLVTPPRPGRRRNRLLARRSLASRIISGTGEPISRSTRSTITPTNPRPHPAGADPAKTTPPPR